MVVRDMRVDRKYENMLAERKRKRERRNEKEKKKKTKRSVEAIRNILC